MTRKNRVILLFCLFCTACAPILATRGNYLDNAQLQTIQQGVSTQEEVAQKLGTPTTVDPFDAKKWFYIGEKTSAKAFLQPKIISRRIIVMQFDENGLLESAKELDEKSAKQVELVKKATPAPGREVSAFEQFIGNIGKFNQPGTSSRPPGQ